MGQPAAKEGDQVVAIDVHVVMVPSANGAVPTPTPLPFSGKLSGDLSPKVFIDNKPAAVKGSTAQNEPAHTAPAGPFQTPPSNKASVHNGSVSVFFDGKAAARLGDPAMTCNDPSDTPGGSVIANGTVLIG
ncbi:MAG: PAAR domain-containing protein [Polyangiaceae bacterium]|nr:PAAR domain-containing protein [Polyangiaceae bacterium]